jgi:hypothetical protein
MRDRGYSLEGSGYSVREIDWALGFSGDHFGFEHGFYRQHGG